METIENKAIIGLHADGRLIIVIVEEVIVVGALRAVRISIRVALL